MLQITKIIENDRSGWHLLFNAEVTQDNFREACNSAIALAKKECPSQNAVAINFVAQGVPVQVVETDTLEIQLALWRHRIKSDKKTVFKVDGVAAQAMLGCLEGIRMANPEMIADHAPDGWEMNRFREAVGDAQSELFSNPAPII